MFNMCTRSCIRQQFNRWKIRQTITPTRYISLSSHTNLRYISTPLTHLRFRNVRKRLQAAQNQVTRLKAKIAKHVESDGLTDIHKDQRKCLLLYNLHIIQKIVS